MQDWQLIRRYVDTQSQAAFAELVGRHLKLVYNTCLRDLRNPQMAEDAAQVVFLVLARKAAGLNKDISLAGWLFRTARFAAKTALRQEGRNKRREQRVGEAMLLNTVEDERAWGRIDGMLNDALDSLPANDREIVLLRYFEEMSYTEIGALLMTTENAATRRTMRALEKLRKYLTARNATVTVASLGALLTAHAAEAAPIGSWLPLSQSISVNAVSGVAVNVAGMNLPELTQGVIHQMFIAKLKTAVLIGGVMFGGVGMVPLTAHVWAAAHRATARPISVSSVVGMPESPPPTPVTLGPAEEKLLAELAKYPVEIKSLSAHIQTHYVHRVPTIVMVRQPDGSEKRVDPTPPPPDEDGDWAFSGVKVYDSEVPSYELDGSPIRTRVYRDIGQLTVRDEMFNGVMYRRAYQASTDELSWTPKFPGQHQGPLQFGYRCNGDWIVTSLKKTGFKIVGTENDPKFGALMVISAQVTEGLNPPLQRFWLAEKYGFICVKCDYQSANFRSHWQAADLEKVGGFWMPTGGAFLSERLGAAGTGIIQQYTEQLSDIRINNVPDSTFLHNLPSGTMVYAIDKGSGKWMWNIMDAAGNLAPKVRPH